MGDSSQKKIETSVVNPRRIIYLYREWQQQAKSQGMSYRLVCFAVILFLIFGSSGFLFYSVMYKDLPWQIQLRLFVFFGQHLFTMGMLVQRKLSENQQNEGRDHLAWIIAFTWVNFIMFGGVEIYYLSSEEWRGEPSLDQLDKVPITTLSYYHLYYQFNIYIGIFSLFSLIMSVIYCLNQRRNRRRQDHVLQFLNDHKEEASGNLEPCPICLVEFQKKQIVYTLVCAHQFHVDCLDKWIKNKLSCPMCRDDLSAYVAEEQEQQANRHQNYSRPYF